MTGAHEVLRRAEFEDLVDAPLDALTSEAARLRDEGHGHRVTFSPKVFIH